MAILSRSTLRNFFKNGDKPNQNNFWDWMDSFFHKTEDKIPITSVTDLTETLNGKANHIALTAESMVREETDTHLQEQIDLLSDVKPLPAIRGIVTGSPTDLENIDTSGFQDGDGYLVTNHDDYTEFYRYNAEEDEWDPSYQWKPLSAVRGVVNNHRDLNSIRNPHTEDSCIVKSDETRNNHTTCYSWNDNWEFVCEWIPGEGGSGTGEGNQNLATADMEQTDQNRFYSLNEGRLCFQNGNEDISSNFVIESPGVRCDFSNNRGTFGFSLVHPDGFDLELHSNVQDTLFYVHSDEINFRNNFSFFNIAPEILDFIYADQIHEKGMRMEGQQGLFIVSKFQGMPSDVIIDGQLKCPYLEDIDQFMPHYDNLSITVADEAGGLHKMKVEKLAELLKPYFMQ